jgi:hypothetical protein
MAAEGVAAGTKEGEDIGLGGVGRGGDPERRIEERRERFGFGFAAEDGDAEGDSEEGII